MYSYGYIVDIGTRGEEKGNVVKLQNGFFPEHILIEVPKGKECTIEGQKFSTDDLPDKLLATYEGLEPTNTIFREMSLIKYSVEPIFSLIRLGGSDYCGNECYNAESVNRLCKIISQPWMHSVRSSMPQDKFITRNTGENPYWLYTPKDNYHLNYVKDGKIWSASIISCESGYYYELLKSKDDSLIRKFVDRSNLSMGNPKAVKPVIFLDAKAFEKSSNMSLEIA